MIPPRSSAQPQYEARAFNRELHAVRQVIRLAARCGSQQVQRIVDGRRLNPQSLMPAYHRVDGLRRVGTGWQGKPVLAAQQVEDVVAFLATLRP